MFLSELMNMDRHQRTKSTDPKSQTFKTSHKEQETKATIHLKHTMEIQFCTTFYHAKDKSIKQLVRKIYDYLGEQKYSTSSNIYIYILNI